MGLNETSKKKESAIKLRFEGKSYNEIRKELGIKSKGTLSIWFSHLRLPPSAQKNLERNQRLAVQRGLLKFNEERSRRITQENKQFQEEGKKLIGVISKRELLLIGTALYWGEGTKAGKKRRNVAFAFTNSDPIMISLFMKFIRIILEIPEEWLIPGIMMYPGMNKNIVKQYWAKITGLSEKRFWTTVSVSSASKRTKESNKLPYGTVSIKVSRRAVFYKMMGMIEGLK